MWIGMVFVKMAVAKMVVVNPTIEGMILVRVAVVKMVVLGRLYGSIVDACRKQIFSR